MTERVLRFAPRARFRFIGIGALTVAMAVGSSHGVAQETQGRELPDTPMPKLELLAQTPSDITQKPGATPLKEALGILGKRSIFFPELAFDRGPLTPRKKLQLAVDETIAPSRFLGSAFTSAIGQARDSLPGYGQGWSGYGKRYGSSVASNASSHLFGTALLPSITHEDPRYFVKLFGSPSHRIFYAISRVVVTRKDDGTETFNLSSVLGGLMAEGLANIYLPDRERTAGKTFTRFGWRIGFGALDNVFKEYWPTIFRSLRINKMTPNEKSDPGTVTPPYGPPPKP